MFALVILAVAGHLSAAQPHAQPACDVTKPNGNVPPSALIEKVGYNGGPASQMHGNGVLWTGLWPDGTVLVKDNQILSDGALRMKFFWFVSTDGPLTVTGKRLDGIARPLRSEIPSGFSGVGFQPSWLIFPTEGCWQVTARANNSELTFVTRVVKAN